MSNNIDNETPEIYVADLAAYNNGDLRGIWIEISEGVSASDVSDKIRDFLAEVGHEEYAIHDYNNLPSGILGEYPSLETIIGVSAAIREHGYHIIKGYLEYFGIDGLDQFDDRFCGVFDSAKDYVIDLISDCYDLNTIPEIIRFNIDYDGILHDMDCNGKIVCVDTPKGVAVFNNF